MMQNYFNGAGGGGFRGYLNKNPPSLIPDSGTLKNEDIEVTALKLKDYFNAQMREPNVRIVTVNAMKGRNYAFFDSLGSLF